MKQKIVIKVCSTMCCDKCRSKAMAVAAATCGVDSVAIDGKYKDEVVVGECVDSVKLTTALRKKLGRADLLHVSEVKKQDDKKPLTPPATSNRPAPAPPAPSNPPPVTFVCNYHHYHRVGYVCPWCGHGYYY